MRILLAFTGKQNQISKIQHSHHHDIISKKLATDILSHLLQNCVVICILSNASATEMENILYVKSRNLFDSVFPYSVLVENVIYGPLPIPKFPKTESRTIGFFWRPIRFLTCQ
jgi:hypothetical protein